MTKNTKPKSLGSKAETREDRLKAALKANMARRKVQAKAKATEKRVEDEDKG